MKDLHNQIKTNLALLGLTPSSVDFDTALLLSAMLDAGAPFECIDMAGGVLS